MSCQSVVAIGVVNRRVLDTSLIEVLAYLPLALRIPKQDNTETANFAR